MEKVPKEQFNTKEWFEANKDKPINVGEFFEAFGPNVFKKYNTIIRKCNEYKFTVEFEISDESEHKKDRTLCVRVSNENEYFKSVFPIQVREKVWEASITDGLYRISQQIDKLKKGKQ